MRRFGKTGIGFGEIKVICLLLQRSYVVVIFQRNITKNKVYRKNPQFCFLILGDSSDVTTNRECQGRYSFVGFSASAVCYNNPLWTGRYVGIMTTRNQILTLCEVEVYSRGKLSIILCNVIAS